MVGSGIAVGGAEVAAGTGEDAAVMDVGDSNLGDTSVGGSGVSLVVEVSVEAAGVWSGSVVPAGALAAVDPETKAPEAVAPETGVGESSASAGVATSVIGV
jgi:hypothetical protein